MIMQPKFDLPLDFKFRNNQEKNIKEIEAQLENHNTTALQSPTDSGKTIVACCIALNQQLPVTWLTSIYPSVPEIIKTLDMLGQRKKLSIVLPKGIRQIRRDVCKQKFCKNCPKKKRKIPKLKCREFKGRVIDARWVSENYSDLCPHRFLLEASKNTDWVITHHKMIPSLFGQGGNLETKGFLIADEVDEALQPCDVLLVKYKFARKHHLSKGCHLETDKEENMVEKALKILAELKEECNPYKDQREFNLDTFREEGNPEEYFFNRWCENFKTILTWLDDEFNKSPIEFELENIEICEKGEGIVKAEGVDRKATINYALRTASQRLEQRVKMFQILLERGELKDATQEISKYNKYYLKKLKPEDRDFLQYLAYCLSEMKSFYFKSVRFSPMELSGYVEVWIVTGGSDFLNSTMHYDKRLFLSATFPANMSKDLPLVKDEVDPYGQRKLNILVPNKNIAKRTLKDSLKTCNILFVTTSIERAKQVKWEYGAEIIGENTSIREVERNCRIHKGNLYVIYYGSKHSRAINTLGCFDGVYFQDYLDKSDPLSLGANDQYRENCVKKLIQTGSRVFRTDENGVHRRRFAITSNPEVFKLLQRETSWNFVETEHAKEAIEIINRHAEPLAVVPLLPPVRFTHRYDKEKKKHLLEGEITPEHLKKYSNLKELTLTDDDLWLLFNKKVREQTESLKETRHKE